MKNNIRIERIYPFSYFSKTQAYYILNTQQVIKLQFGYLYKSFEKKHAYAYLLYN